MFDRGCCLWYSNERLLRVLLRAGARVNERDNDGETALMYAAMRGQDVYVDLLLKAGADKELRNSIGRTALMLAEEEGHENCAQLLRDKDVRMTRTLARSQANSAAERSSE